MIILLTIIHKTPVVFLFLVSICKLVLGVANITSHAIAFLATTAVCSAKINVGDSHDSSQFGFSFPLHPKDVLGYFFWGLKFQKKKINMLYFYVKKSVNMMLNMILRQARVDLNYSLKHNYKFVLFQVLVSRRTWTRCSRAAKNKIHIKKKCCCYLFNFNSLAPRASWGGHWGLRCCGIGLLFLRYFGNLNLHVRYRGII